MPAKSRRSKKRYSPLRKKNRSSHPTRLAQTVATRAAEPASASPVATSPTSPPPLVTKLPPASPYIGTELRTIGILAGVILVILVVLALVLSRHGL